MSITAFPLCWPSSWPRASSRNAKARVDAMSFARSRDRLGQELERLKAADIILSTNVPLKFDGQPRGDYVEPQDPGVAVYFSLRGKPMVMARDVYPRVAQNLHSLAIAIGHLRGLERHGGATMMERAFTGFAALPEPGRVAPWREILGFPPNAEVTDTMIEARFRELAMQRHPDRGGSDQQMAELNQAREMAIAESVGAA